jgi:hypothetical protein
VELRSGPQARDARRTARAAGGRRRPATVGRERERHAIVVGAGLAGPPSSLASRGWRVTIVDAAPWPATGASSLHAGSFHPLVARDDSLLARLSRAAFLHALDAWRELERRGHAIAWDRCGVLQLARRHDGDDALRAAIDALGFPASFVEHVDAAGGSARAGLRVDRPGAWFPEGGWARAPSSYVPSSTRDGHARLWPAPGRCSRGRRTMASEERCDDRRGERRRWRTPADIARPPAGTDPLSPRPGELLAALRRRGRS